MNLNSPFDLNFLPDENGASYFYEVPNYEQHDEDEGVSEGNNTENFGIESNQEVQGDVPILDRSSSSGIQPIDPNIQSTEEEHQSPTNIENDDMSQCGSGARTSYRLTSNEERKLIYAALLARSSNGKLKRNSTNEVSSLLSVPLRTVQRIWKDAKETPTSIVVDPSHRWPKNSGRKRVEVDLNRIIDIPLKRRTTLRSLSHALKINHVTLHSRLKEGLLRRHSNAIAPYLKEENKISRLQFCMSMLERSSLPHEPRFAPDLKDEKWFYMTKKSTNYYLLPDEADPLRSCQSKNFIGKVMFLAVVARPRFDDEGNEVFSGKIGVFPLVTVEPALRRSRNREAETLETKPITSVKKETIRAFLLEKVIPAIRDKWPREDSNTTIFIQQDNARTHVWPTDEEFHMAASQNGFDIRLLCQPTNSPDLNVLDLGFFRVIQSLQDKECTRTVDELIGVVQRAFNEYPAQKINHVFLSLQLCMREIMIAEGFNRYKITHINKARLERTGSLPTTITCEFDLVEKTKSILGRSEMGNE